MQVKTVELDPSLAEDFVTEAQEYLDNIDQKILDMESQLSDKECVNDIFRAIHTIKGLSGFLELELIGELSHKLETILDEIRKDKREVTSEVIDILFQGVDLIRKLIDDVKSLLESGNYVYEPSAERVDEVEAMLQTLTSILGGGTMTTDKDRKDTKVSAEGQEVPQKEEKEKAKTKAKATSKKKKKKAQATPKTTTEPVEAPKAETAPEPDTGAEPKFQIPEKLYKDFQIEAAEHLDICDQALITLDKQRNNLEAINNLFRSIHTIKGSSSYLGLKSIAAFTHGLEELLDLVRKKESFYLADELMDIFFESIDCLKGLVDSPTDPQYLQTSHALLERIITEKNKLQSEKSTELLEATPSQKKNTPESVFLQSARQFADAYKSCLEKLKSNNGTDPETLSVLERAIQSLKSSAAYMGYSRLEKIVELSDQTLQSLRKGEIASPLVAVEFLEDNLKEINYFLNEVERGNVREDSGQENAEKTTPEETKSEAKTEPQPATEKTENPSAAPASAQPAAQAAKSGTSGTTGGVKTMRIDQHLLDVFMNLVGELIVTRNAFGHVIRHLENHAEDRDKAMKDLRAASQSITRISEEMQRVVMDMRMVPMRNVFQKFPRMVRDLTRKTNKNVDLIIQGEETEIDKGIAEVIGDPLIHIIRNAVDHGIEPPDVRRQAGKPEKGTIILRAAHEGNYIVIEVIDDGKGLDPDLILQKAIEKGLTTPEKAKHLTQEDIYNFIFMPGFSTAKQVTDISGRGVGMDVVRTNLRKLKGNIRVSSEVGQGTHVRLEVPLTLAIIEALLVGVGEDIFAIPIEAVTETVKLKRDELHSLMAKKAFSLRGEVICVEFLSHLLNISSNGYGDPAEREEIPILIIQAGGERLGLAVDEMYRQEEIVVKPLADYLADLPGLAGASIFGDGKAILILDPEELVSMATESMAA